MVAEGKAKQVPFQPELCVLGLGSEVPTACCLCLTSVHGKWWRSEGRGPPAEVCVSTITKVTVHSHFQYVLSRASQESRRFWPSALHQPATPTRPSSLRPWKAPVGMGSGSLSGLQTRFPQALVPVLTGLPKGRRRVPPASVGTAPAPGFGSGNFGSWVSSGGAQPTTFVFHFSAAHHPCAASP